jgi:hypothetical protein
VLDSTLWDKVCQLLAAAILEYKYKTPSRKFYNGNSREKMTSQMNAYKGR